jgi:apolipoprotein N-acyltransferase
MTNAGPKIFAAKTGFVFTCVISLLYWLGIPAASDIFALILALFAFLEAAAGFCVACRLYPFMPDFVK